MLLDHLDAGPAVLGNLIDVSVFEKAEAYVAVAQAISRARFAVAVKLQFGLIEDAVEHLLEFVREEPVRGLRFFQLRFP